MARKKRPHQRTPRQPARRSGPTAGRDAVVPVAGPTAAGPTPDVAPGSDPGAVPDVDPGVDARPDPDPRPEPDAQAVAVRAGEPAADDAAVADDGHEDAVAEDAVLGDDVPEDSSGDAVPEDAVPEDAVPEDAVPEDAVPEEGLPEEGLPEEGLPDDALPGEGLPGEAVPEDAVPGDTVPEGAVPADAVPADAVPADAVPEEAVPEEHSNGDAPASDLAPGPETPGEAAPVEATPSAEAAPGAPGERRAPGGITRGKILAGLLSAILGFALVAQVHQNQKAGLTGLRQSDLVGVLARVSEQSARLEQESRRLQEARDALRAGRADSEAAERLAQERLRVLAVLTGSAPAVGPGVTLRVDDPNRVVDAAHLLDAVQELRDAGAEAMQLNGVRIVASTAFVDADPGSVLVDGRATTAPYRLTVIGDEQGLAAALEIPGGVLEVLQQAGARPVVTPSGRLVVDARHAPVAPSFARPAPEPSRP